MKDYQFIKNNQNFYSIMEFERNPFSITPLFRSFKSRAECEKEEKIFILPDSIARDANILTRGENKRVLVYGHYGVGKTSLVDFILYVMYHYRHKFCIRLIITEDNIQHAINEILLTLCQEIISELATKKITEPISAVRKWLAEQSYSDILMESILKLMGFYQETNDHAEIKRKKTHIGFAPQGIGLNQSYEQEIQVRKTIQAYVQVLPMRKMIEYMELFYEIIRRLGFQEIVIFVDEADHLENIDRFLSLLTKAREILFSKGYTFFICGSVEIARFTEAMGAIFDRLVRVQPADKILFMEMLDARIQAENATLRIQNIFEDNALNLIHQMSNGIQKHFIRLAENALELAISLGERKITENHCIQIMESNKDSVSVSLSDTELIIMNYLSQNGIHSSSDVNFQDCVRISRAQLRNILEQLYERGYVHKDKKGRKNYYSVTSQYLPYFKQKAKEVCD